MKFLSRWSKTLLLAGTLTFASMVSLPSQVWALTQEQVVETLGVMPIFFVLSQNNQLVFITTEQGEQVSPRFISRDAAQAFLNSLAQSNPQLSQQARIAALPLGELYRLDNEQSNRQEVDFAYLSLEDGQFYETPLFYATVGDDSVTLTQNGEQVIPFFFDQASMNQMIERFKQAQPNLASQVQVKAVPLEGFIQTLQTSNDRSLTQIQLVLPPESIEFVRSVQQQMQQQPRQ
ncbi:MAG: Tic22 family protein [Jaaginema sp. PMC 1079.18]|nr:Tic22 family protein [Jaaginema sp. PMC 1080.18]MEC4851537.1 Tic22 family protein [Jaaginema sp. PMC 1079.18]MEC4865753.1 Tic22 family protein [Jaaginema sp. PMC 1078.18]